MLLQVLVIVAKKVNTVGSCGSEWWGQGAAIWKDLTKGMPLEFRCELVTI